MKKILLIIITIVILAGGFLYFKKDKVPTAVAPGAVSNNTFHPDPKSATFTFDGDAVKLTNGKGEQANPDTGTTEETQLLEQRAYGDINNDSKDDTIVFLAQSGGGSGTFVYVAAYVSGPVNYKGTNAVFLGDRIAPQTISFNNGVATVKYFDRGPDEPFAAEPTIPVTKQFVYKNGSLEEKK